METITRIYKTSDPFMQEFTKTMREHFVEDQAAFATFDPDFANPYEEVWLTAINTSGAQPTDEIVIDQLTQLTADVEAAMTNARNKFQDSKYFIEKAFPNNVPVWNEFGYDNYNGIRLDQRGMIEFMKLLHTTATKYAAELTTAGYNAAAIAEIETLMVALDTANTTQEKFKGDRGVITQTRISAHNALWDITTRTSKAGKVVFRNDAARYNLCLLPASDENPAQLSIIGIVTDQATSDPIQEAEVSIASEGITVLTDSNGAFGIASLANGSYNLEVAHPNYQATSLNDVVVDDSGDVPTSADAQMVANP